MPIGTARNRVRFLLFAGALALFLAVYKGDGGYGDIQEYLDDAQRLWLTGDTRIADPDGGFHYSRYVQGLPFLSGPFVLAGHALSIASSGAISERSVSALIVPILGALAVVLIFEWSRLLGAADKTAVASAFIVAFNCPFPNYTRYYFTEVLGFVATYLACVSFQRSRIENSRSSFWLGLAGVAVGFLPHSHMSSLPTFASLFLGLNVLLLWQTESPLRVRIRRALVFSAVPLLSITLFALMNFLRYGNPLTTGYHVTFSGQVFMEFRNIARNVPNFASWFLRTPWLILCIPALYIFSRKDRLLAGTLLLAIAAQTLFWFCYRDLLVTTFRYLLMLTALYSLGFPILSKFIAEKWPKRGMVYAALAAGLWGLAGFMLGDDAQAIFRNESNGKIYFYTWYMSRPGRSDVLGSPGGTMQFVIFTGLTVLGLSLLIAAWIYASRQDEAPE